MTASARGEIRESRAADQAALEVLYAAAFPDEDLLALLRALLGAPPAGGVAAVSLVAARDGVLVGHVAFTECRVAGVDARPALLGPLAVAPEAQRQGVGYALVEAGLARLAADGFAQVFALGDPAYYGRFGFNVEERVATPCPIPDDWRGAWRSKRLDNAAPALAGALAAPPPWDDPIYWAP